MPPTSSPHAHTTRTHALTHTHIPCSRRHKCWNKLAAWTLTKYDKIVVMDPDIIAWENADELFEYPELSAVPDYGFQVRRRNGVVVVCVFQRWG